LCSQLIETSGVADAQPLASLLAKHGFELECVVAVVDGEAGLTTLSHQPVAAAQLRAADVVVVNKCDVASLAAVADLEDEVRRLVPGIRILRAKFGHVPLPSLLDVEVADRADGKDGGATPQTLQQRPAGLEGGYLSHEPTFRGGGSDGSDVPWVPGGMLPSYSESSDGSHHARTHIYIYIDIQ
jgi:G3E family GTPase